MAKRGYDKERGQSLAVFACVLTALLVCMALAFDMGYANLVRTRTADMVQQAESECMLPYVALQVKNSDAPGHDMCAELVSALRRQGYDGAVSAYFYEPTRAEAGLPENERVYVFGVTVEAEAETLIGHALGTHSIPTRITAWSHAEPYATYETWRPATSDNGVYRVGAGEASGSWSPVSVFNEEEMPGGQSELDRALAEII